MSAPPLPVVCGVDGSPSSVAAAHAAAQGASLRGTGLLLVRAFSWPTGGVPGLPAGAAGRRAARHSAAAELSRVSAAVAYGRPGCPVTSSLVDGLPDVLLTSMSRAAPLLVVGAHGHSWPDGPSLGSVASGVARQAGCPVLVHRPATAPQTVGHAGWARARDPDTAPGGVVVGIDGEATTGALLEAAARVAELIGRGLWALNGGDGIRPEERSRVVTGVAGVQRDHPLLWVEHLTRPGGASALLVEASRTAAVVVVGRTDGPGPMLLHGTTRALLRRARCPVLVLPLRVPDRSVVDVVDPGPAPVGVAR